MLVLETIAKVRRAHFVDGKPIKQICRELKLSRKVVRKVLRSEKTAFEYKRNVQPHPKLGAWREELERLLAANAARGRRERVTLLRISEDLQSLGYALRANKRETSDRLKFTLGGAYERTDGHALTDTAFAGGRF